VTRPLAARSSEAAGPVIRFSYVRCQEAPAIAPAGSDRSSWDLWDRVEALVDSAPSVPALREHRLHLAAVRIWRARDVDVPRSLERPERYSAMSTIVAPILLERARAAYDGQLMLMKGLEVAARYRHPADRPFRDLDLLVDDADAAQRALVAAGFVEVGNPDAYERAQHLCPLAWPGIPLVIELHRRPNQPRWLPRPSTSEILELATPSATGIRGVLAPTPAAHALLLLAHSWTHQPLGRVADLVDVAAVLGADERLRTDELARRWKWDGMWRTSIAAVDAVVGRGGPEASLPVWARHLSTVRDRTVIENHIARIAAPAWALPPQRAPRAIAGALRHTAGRRDEEQWADKLRRSRRALAHAFMKKSSHERTL
jgi:Uncharacterised nucleotidyltransferase